MRARIIIWDDGLYGSELDAGRRESIQCVCMCFCYSSLLWNDADTWPDTARSGGWTSY